MLGNRKDLYLGICFFFYFFLQFIGVIHSSFQFHETFRNSVAYNISTHILKLDVCITFDIVLVARKIQDIQTEKFPYIC